MKKPLALKARWRLDFKNAFELKWRKNFFSTNFSRTSIVTVDGICRALSTCAVHLNYYERSRIGQVIRTLLIIRNYPLKNKEWGWDFPFERLSFHNVWANKKLKEKIPKKELLLDSFPSLVLCSRREGQNCGKKYKIHLNRLAIDQ